MLIFAPNEEKKLENSEDTAIREAFLEAVANGSAVSWQHINLLG